MKAKVLKTFIDKFTRERYSVGSEIELADMARVADLARRGLILPNAEKKVEKDPEVKPEVEPEEKPKAKPKKKATKKK